MLPRFRNWLLTGTCAALSLALPPANGQAASPIAPTEVQAAKPRLIVLTDIGTEPDDMESMVRLLTYANEIEIEGLVATTSRHLRHEVGRHLIEERARAYAQVVSNLRVHDPAYPDPQTLMSRIRSTPAVYGMAGVGKGRDNEASRLIVETVDRSDSRPVWIAIWGGAQPLAQALWSVKAKRSPKLVREFVAKLRVYSISDQDDAGPWARATFPELFWIASIHGPTQYELAAWTGISAATPGADPEPVSRKWLDRNIRSKGPLGEVYPAPIFIMEGDTPSFLHLIPNGLGTPERPDWGSWGGRYGQIADGLGLWTDAQDKVRGRDGKTVVNNKATVWRWRQAFQNDFAARMAWSVTPRYKDANHAPRPVLNGKPGLGPVRIRACPGASIELNARGSADPDGNTLSYRWWWYSEIAGIFTPGLELSQPEGMQTVATVPVWTQPFKIVLPPAYQMHVILEVSDNGAPALTRYRRAILEIPTRGGTDDAGRTCAPITQVTAPPLPRTTAQVVKLTDSRLNSGDTPIGVLLDDPASREIIARHLPSLPARAGGNPQGRGMTLEGLSHFDPSITTDVMARIDADLATLPQ